MLLGLFWLTVGAVVKSSWYRTLASCISALFFFMTGTAFDSIASNLPSSTSETSSIRPGTVYSTVSTVQCGKNVCAVVQDISKKDGGFKAAMFKNFPPATFMRRGDTIVEFKP
ncbi:MAG TPA: hypothetical protein VF803_00785 [Candidatus Paceibacterota bacterium]